MIALFVAARRLWAAAARALRSPEAQVLIATTAVVIAGGSLFYAVNEGWSAVDALYFTVITLMTIGYGDLAPTNDISKLFTVVYAFVGVGLVASTIGLLAVAAVENERDRIRKRHDREAEPSDQAGAPPED